MKNIPKDAGMVLLTNNRKPDTGWLIARRKTGSFAVNGDVSWHPSHALRAALFILNLTGEDMFQHKCFEKPEARFMYRTKYDYSCSCEDE